MLEKYTQRLEPARNAICTSEVSEQLLNDQLDDQLLLRFMIEFCSRGVALTEPVDTWVRRAGQRTVELGYEKVGTQLIKHAKHEEGHHVMQIDDTHALVARYNKMYGTKLDAQSLISRPAFGAAVDYVKLHEDVIESDSPFRQVAIEREIEGLSVMIGPGVVAQCSRVLGSDNLQEVSFLAEHVELDVGHTAFNEKLLQRMLDARPDSLDALVEAGTHALEVYGRFLAECWETAGAANLMGSSVSVGSMSGVAPRGQVPLT